jgi:hypothetical protein
VQVERIGCVVKAPKFSINLTFFSSMVSSDFLSPTQNLAGFLYLIGILGRK